MQRYADANAHCVYCQCRCTNIRIPRSVLCSQLTVFGDSLSDDGIEVDEHSHGFIRNSNGPVWPEYLNKMLACDKPFYARKKENGKQLH
uniref:Uncharacterized protein n=1 Tax=Parascaris equorum TaxID=6256 RepID=A0A914RJQ5_PAREQ